MRITYGEKIEFDPERNDYAARQHAVVEIAKLLLLDNIIPLKEPTNVSVVANIDTGKVEVKSTVGSVNNLFSNEDQITQLVQEAVALIAKYEVIKRLAQVSGHEDIQSVIRKNHVDLGRPEDNLGKVNVTLMAINHQRRGTSGLGLFSRSNSQAPKSYVDSVITAVLEGKIRCRNDIDPIFQVAQEQFTATKVSNR